ncbi:MAG TPA: LamG domain-containing protein [Candidatus Hydrogenedentes bacterium]|nr:LamG domain-containing protein [Candidatus Hydrogenedentota bacterium]
MFFIHRFLATFFALGMTSVALAGPLPAVHWKLLEDGQDSSGKACHLENHGVEFNAAVPDGSRAARFDGRSAFLEAPNHSSPQFGPGDFTVSLWVYTKDALDDTLGDLLSTYDPATRTGLNLSILTCTGVSNSQPNYRNLHFGIDKGTEVDQWSDCGRPGNAIFIFGMVVHEGALYAATCESGVGESGHVYRYEGGASWTDCGSPGSSNSIGALAVYNGALYAGASWYDTTGSALEASPNTTPGGTIYRYDGGKQWVDCGSLENPETGKAITIGGLTVFNGKLYATTLKKDGFGLYRYEGSATWAYCGNPGRRVLNPSVFNGSMYMVSYDAPGGPFRYDGANWSYVGGTINPPIDQDYSFAVYGGQLHVSTWPKAYVYRMNENFTWTPCGKPGEENESMGMMTYNGKLYVGTLPSARVYRYDDADKWTPIGQQLDTSEGKYRRAWSMAIFQGKLFCGTLPSGKIFCMEAGKNVTCDVALKPGWRHIAAVRESDRLRLFIDGQPVAESTKSDSTKYDLATDQPLRIGSGAGDYFYGWMKDLRIYETALREQEITALCNEQRPSP